MWRNPERDAFRDRFNDERERLKKERDLQNKRKAFEVASSRARDAYINGESDMMKKSLIDEAIFLKSEVEALENRLAAMRKAHAVLEKQRSLELDLASMRQTTQAMSRGQKHSGEVRILVSPAASLLTSLLRYACTHTRMWSGS